MLTGRKAGIAATVKRTTQGRVLAIDPGKVRIGIAMSDEDRVLATPRGVLDGSDRRRALKTLAELCGTEGVTHILVGMPHHMTGERGAAGPKIVKFAQELADASGIEVELVDERWTTVEAMRRAKESEGARGKKKAPIDDAAAAVLLQAWLSRA